MCLSRILLLSLTATLLYSAPASGQVDTWVARSDIPTSRVFHATCTVAGKIYVFGGQRAGGENGITSVEEYDPVTNSWRGRADLPSARMGMTAAAVDGKCYLIGGTAEPVGGRFNRVDEYNPASDSWRRRADAPTARFAAASAVVDGKIYVAGGWDSAGLLATAVTTLEVYDPLSDTWTSGADMPTGRGMLAASAAQGQIFFIGGGNVIGAVDTSIVESYDPISDSWSDRQDMPTPRGTLAAGTVGGLVYAIGGGFDVEEVATVEVYDPSSDTWAIRTPMPAARWGVMSAVVGNKIYVLGGSTERGVGHNSLSTNEAYTATDFSINAGLNGNWWNGPGRSGEGVQVEVADAGNGNLVFVATVYSYDTLGNQIFLVAIGNVNGSIAEVDLFITDGGVWGDNFDPALVSETQWGTGAFTASSCDSIHMTLIPNAEFQGMGYTNLEYELVRLTTPSIPCPA